MSYQKVVMITGGILSVYVLGTFLQWKVRWKYTDKPWLMDRLRGKRFERLDWWVHIKVIIILHLPDCGMGLPDSSLGDGHPGFPHTWSSRLASQKGLKDHTKPMTTMTTMTTKTTTTTSLTFVISLSSGSLRAGGQGFELVEKGGGRICHRGFLGDVVDIYFI